MTAVAVWFEDVCAALRARPRHLLLAALTLGLLLGPFDRRLTLAAALGVLFAAVGVVRRPPLALALAVFTIGGSVLAHARLATLDVTRLRSLVGHELDARATVVERPRTLRFGGWSAAAVLVASRGAGERIVLRSRRDVPRPRVDVGDELHVRGLVEALAPWEGYQRVCGAHAAVVPRLARPTGHRRGGAAGAVDGVRRAAEGALLAGLPVAQAALARGMVLGQDDSLDDRTRADFRRSGLAHLLAASGQNVTLLAIVAAAVLGVLGLGLRGRLLGALALVALYVPLAGAGPSIVRAGVMGAAGLVAGLAGRPGSRAYALLLAAGITLALNPRSSADVGWQLSFAAVVAIGLLAGRWRDALQRRSVPRAVAETAGVSAAATVGTAPLMALHFGQLSLVSLPANLLAAPAVAPVVWLGSGAALLGQLGDGALGHTALHLATLLDAVAAFPLGFVGWVAHVAASVPGATAAVSVGGPLALAAIYGALGGLVASRRLRLLAVGAAAALVALAAWSRLHPPGPPSALTISFLDIGQGDATLVQHAGRSVLIDTGPPDGPILDRLRSAGVRRLDLLVLTHAQSDHEGAAPAILASLPVGAVLDGGLGRRSAERAAIERAERREAAREIVPDAGESLRMGPLALDVLWPHRADTADPAADDPNARAVVARLHDGAFDMLLTADAESSVTLPLDLSAVDVLKVAHHGSADPGLPQLLARLRPSVAAIEVGRHNSYGHPSPSTLRALRVVPNLVRTDRDGTVRLTVTGDRMELRTHA